MTLTLDLKTWFNVTTHPLPKDTLWVKYKPDWAQGKEDMLPTSNLRQIDGWKNRQTADGQTDQYRAFAERGPN